MSLVKRNVIANLIGSAWVALVSIAFIPLYIHFMGVEAYGLIGFYVTLQALFAILDMGLSATLSRELARLSAIDASRQKMRDLVRTLESIYWAIAVVVMFIIIVSSSWIAATWLNISDLSEENVGDSIMLMGVVIALRMPYGFYAGGLLGLQRQIVQNLIRVVVETIKGGGVLLVLWLIAPTVTAFFIWQVIASVIGVLSMGFFLWSTIPGEHAMFRSTMLGEVWKFAAGMSGIMIVGTILMQTDKLILSRMISLEEFAYYALASSVAAGLYMISTPLFSAFYPSFTQLVTKGEHTSLSKLYHKSSQLMSVLLLPLTCVITLFSNDILLVWTQNAELAYHAAPMLSLLVVGAAVNCVVSIPYALQLAQGETRRVLIMNVVALILLIPTLMIVIPTFGAAGAAWVWLLLNLGYLTFGIQFFQRKLLRDELSRWYIFDIALPALTTVVIAFFMWIMMPQDLTGIVKLAWILLCWILCLAGAIASASLLRGGAISQFKVLVGLGRAH